MPFWKKSSSPSSTADLVRAAQKGNRTAFGVLFSQYAAMVHGVLLSKVSPNEADDLVQDVFVTALEKIGELRDVETFGGWLAAIARNKGIDFYKKKRPTEILPDNLGKESPDTAQAKQILRAICVLPEAYREPLILRLVEGLTGPEIAAQTGLTEGSVRVNLHRGMALLRESLGLVTDENPQKQRGEQKK